VDRGGTGGHPALFGWRKRKKKRKDEKEKWAVACGHTAGGTMA